MKKLLFIILSLVPLFTFSQVNKSIVDTTKQWNVMHGYASPIGWGSGRGTYFYKISSQDSIINGYNYNKLLIKYDSSQNSNWYFRDWIREENNIVYVYTINPTFSSNNTYNLNPCEYILYDFNLSVGDTFVQTREDVFSGSYMFPSTVIAVDSIEVNGTMLKKITLDFHGEEWIEGVGSANGFLESLIEAYDIYFGLLCVHQGNDLIYQDEYDPCYVYEGTNDINVEDNLIKIYPTIVRDVLKIETQDNDIKELEIIDVLGRVVKKEFIYNNKQVNCSKLNAGVYNCVITTKYNKRVAKKFIKQ